MLNSIGALNTITEICLKYAQLLCNSHIPVFDLSITQLQQLEPKFNLAINELITTKSMGINIEVNKFEFNSIVSGSELTCMEAVNTYIKEIQSDNAINNTIATHRVRTIRKGMRKLSERDVFFVN